MSRLTDHARRPRRRPGDQRAEVRSPAASPPTRTAPAQPAQPPQGRPRPADRRRRATPAAGRSTPRPRAERWNSTAQLYVRRAQRRRPHAWSLTIAQVPRDTGVEDGIPPDGVVPADIVRALARLRLLEGVPFSYLVPDAELTAAGDDPVLLPRPQRHRRARAGRAERRHGQLGRPGPARPAVPDRARRGRPGRAAGADEGLRRADGRRGRAGRSAPAARSPASCCARGWCPAGRACTCAPTATDTRPDDKTIPDMDTSPDRVRLLRMERLAPAVLLVLFDGVPAVVHLEEPRSGIQFGVRLDPAADPTQQTAVVTVRDVAHPNNGPLQVGGQATHRAGAVPAGGAPGVINMKKLQRRAAWRCRAPTWDRRSTRPSTRCRCCASRCARCSATPRSRRHFDAFAATVKIPALTQRFAARERRCCEVTQFSPDQIRQAALSPRWAALSQTGGVAADLDTLRPVPDPRAAAARAGRRAGARRARGRQRHRPAWSGCRSATARPTCRRSTSPTRAPRGRPASTCCGRCRPRSAAARSSTTRPRPTTPPGAGCTCRCCPTAGWCCGSPCPAGATDPIVTGWVIEADAGTVTPLTALAGRNAASGWRRRSRSRSSTCTSAGRRGRQCYDAALGRCACYDDLADLAGIERRGRRGRLPRRRLVVGERGRSARRRRHRHRLPPAARRARLERPRPPEHRRSAARDAADDRYRVAETFGLPATAALQPAAARSPPARPARVGRSSGIDQRRRPRCCSPPLSGFLHEAVARGTAAARTDPHRRCCTAACTACRCVAALAPDSAPAADRACGWCSARRPRTSPPTVTVAGAGIGTADQDARRSAERLLAAFSVRAARCASTTPTPGPTSTSTSTPTAFGSLPGGTEGVDRFVDKPGPHRRPGRRRSGPARSRRQASGSSRAAAPPRRCCGAPCNGPSRSLAFAVPQAVQPQAGPASTAG